MLPAHRRKVDKDFLRDECGPGVKREQPLQRRRHEPRWARILKDVMRKWYLDVVLLTAHRIKWDDRLVKYRSIRH